MKSPVLPRASSSLAILPTRSPIEKKNTEKTEGCEQSKESMIMLKDVTEYLTSKNLAETANDLSKGSVSYLVHLAESQTKSVSRKVKVTDYFK